jgi:hypothetical protein
MARSVSHLPYFDGKTSSSHLIKRTLLGDPAFVTNMDIYQAEIINATTAARTRSMISDTYTQNVSAYDPRGYVSLTERVPLPHSGTRRLTMAATEHLRSQLRTTQAW